MANYKDALEKAVEYFNGDELAAQVFLGKYALTSPDGNILEPTPKQMHERLAKEFARIEAKYPNPLPYEEILAYFENWEIVPQGSPMAGIGNPFQTMSISNCFVIESPYDSYSGILKTDQEEAQIMKRRGGVGFDISTIRPKGIATSNAAKTTDGIGVFMERFSNTCREVAQGGRRGALMLSISVHHPEIETFINIKRDLKKVTGANISIRLTDEFMNAVKNNTDVELRWPVDSKEPSITTTVNANEIWNQIIDSAWASAEPGLLFWDTVDRETPTHCYPAFKSTSTNPCFSGDTMIAVADGRNAVSIKQLAEEGKDVPVYSLNQKTGMASIKIARNPRVTGHGQKLVRIKLDDGSHFDVTPNHKCLLLDGTTVEAKDLKKGDSLPRFVKEKKPVSKGGKDYWLMHMNARNMLDSRIFEHRLISQFNQPELWEEKLSKEKKNGWMKGGLVVHHKDYNSLNNAPENLQVMTFKDHQRFHAEHDNTGENNGKYSGYTDEQIKEHAILLTKNLNRRFSTSEWVDYAKSNNLPQSFSLFRQTSFKNPIELAKVCATELGFENADADPRLVKTLINMIEQGYEANIAGNQVFVTKTCETCNNDYSIQHDKREIAFCSQACSLAYVNSNKEIAEKRTAARNEFAKEQSEKNMKEQARIYSMLKFKLSRDPKQEEWEQVCKQESVPSRVGKVLKHGFKTWKEVKEAGSNYNHKVVSVEELSGEHTVYNLTVDVNHTVGLITDVGQSRHTGVYVANCGEIVLSPFDSCRLLLVNVSKFINNPFGENSEFDVKRFQKACYVAQKLMDDIVDIELECIDKILNKIHSDPEPEHVKKIEIDLWNNIRAACVNGRRTGLGVTAVGDSVAMLNCIYGSNESIEIVETFYRELALNAYRATVDMAKDREPFPVYDYSLEKDHPFINRIMELDPELRKNWEKHGRRNIGLTTTAPAGSVSVLTQTTSGIEPAFLVSYKRRKKINPNDKQSRVDFVDELGDKWQEYTVYHHQFKNWMNATGKTDIKDSPYFGATSNDIDWVQKVKVQAAAQKWICHAISNTTNLPADTTKETVKNVYMTGWESGCKGVTIYRDGCRSGVLVSDEPKKEEFNGDSDNQRRRSADKVQERHAPKRPKELPCEVHAMTVGGEKWTFFVGTLEGKPYEIIGGLSKFVSIPKRVKTGKLVKHNGPENPVARYDFHYDFEKGQDEETVIKDVTNCFENATYGAFTRTMSLALRHGTPLQYVVEQLTKGSEKEDDLFSFSKAATRVLKQYIADGTKADKKCKECGADGLIFQEGCLLCSQCGSSKCG